MNQIQNKNNYHFKICDRDNTDGEIFKRFHNLPFKNKISFGIEKHDSPNHILISESENGLTVHDGVKLYRHLENYLDIIEWIKSGKQKKTIFSKIKLFVINM